MEPNTPPSLEIQSPAQAARDVLRRIDEFQQQAIAAPGDLFPIKLFTAQLVRLSLKLEQFIEASFGQAASLERANPRLPFAMDMYLKVLRQAERNIRLASDLQKASAPRPQRLEQAPGE